MGGQLLLSSKTQHKDELKNEIEYLSNQLKKLDVEIITEQEFTEDKIDEYSPDAIILATGAKPCVPNIPGITESHVFTAWDVLAERVQVGKRVVIVGGGNVGCETAEFLQDRCEEVSILEMLPELALNAEPYSRIYLLERLADQGIKMITQSRVIEIDGRKVVYLDDEGCRQHLETDSVVLAMGAVPENNLALKLKGKVAELLSAGDCISPRLIADAIQDGYNAALSIGYEK